MVVGNCKWPDRSVAAIQCCQFSQIWHVTRFFFFKERLVTASISDSCGRFDGFIRKGRKSFNNNVGREQDVLVEKVRK